MHMISNGEVSSIPSSLLHTKTGSDLNLIFGKEKTFLDDMLRSTRH